MRPFKNDALRAHSPYTRSPKNGMCTVQEEIVLNVQLASNFLASLLKKNWQNIKVRLCDVNSALWKY